LSVGVSQQKGRRFPAGPILSLAGLQFMDVL
jgi:hypothetical protein